MDSIEKRMETLRLKLEDERFLSNKGLSNEVGIYIFAYQPQEEMAVRTLLLELKKAYDGRNGRSRAIVHDLYAILTDICAERRVLDRLPQFEQQKGREKLLGQVQMLATPEEYVKRMDYAPHLPGDVLMITGVGKVYPYMRSHNILNNLQHLFPDVPVVLFYPGAFNGQTLTLFGKFMDDHYYRAFNLI